jgi:hypothetical protein
MVVHEGAANDGIQPEELGALPGRKHENDRETENPPLSACTSRLTCEQGDAHHDSEMEQEQRRGERISLPADHPLSKQLLHTFSCSALT